MVNLEMLILDRKAKSGSKHSIPRYPFGQRQCFWYTENNVCTIMGYYYL